MYITEKLLKIVIIKLIKEQHMSGTFARSSTITSNKTEEIADNALDGIYDNTQNTIWYIADGVVYYYNLNNNERNVFIPNGPFSNTHWRLKYSNGRIFSIPGGRWAVNYYTPGSLSIYENGIWNNF